MRDASGEMLRLAALGDIDLNQLAQWELHSRRGSSQPSPFFPISRKG
jgi:hypothetical protein